MYSKYAERWAQSRSAFIERTSIAMCRKKSFYVYRAMNSLRFA